MKHLRTALVVRIFALSQLCWPAIGQEADFFWSTQDLNQGAQNGPLYVSTSPGQALSLFLYYSSNGLSDQDLQVGALLDMAASQENVIRFVGAESFNFELQVENNTIPGRWLLSANCKLNTTRHIGWVSDSFINEWDAFGVCGPGMIDQHTGPVFFDIGYDASADAFLFGRIDI